MFNEDKVTEIFYMADEFCKFMIKCLIDILWKTTTNVHLIEIRPTMSKAEIILRSCLNFIYGSNSFMASVFYYSPIVTTSWDFLTTNRLLSVVYTWLHIYYIPTNRVTSVWASRWWASAETLLLSQIIKTLWLCP